MARFTRTAFLLGWTSQIFCFHGLKHDTGGNSEDGMLEKLAKQFIIVMKLQG